MKSSNFTPRQQKAVATLQVHPTLTEAAKSAGISERTLRRWRQQEPFQASLQNAQRHFLDAAIKQLHDTGAEAVDVLFG